MNDQRDSGDGRRAWREQHLWQFQPVRDLLVGLGIFGILYLGYVLSVVTVPLLLALLLAYLFEPVVKRLAGSAWLGRRGAVIMILCAVMLVSTGLVAGAAYGIVRAAGFIERQAGYIQLVYSSLPGSTTPSPEANEGSPADESSDPSSSGESGGGVEDEAGDAGAGSLRSPADGAEELDESEERAERAAWRDSVPTFWEELRDLIVMNETLVRSDSFEAFKRWVDRNRAEIAATGFSTIRGVVRWVTGAISSVGMILFGAFLTAFFYFFFATKYPRVLHHGENLLPDEQRDESIYLLKQMDAVISGFVRGRLTIAVIQAVFFSFGYWAIGVPLPFLIGPVIAILSIVPYLAIIGIPISIVLMLIQPSPFEWQNAIWWSVAAPVAVYFIVQALDDYLLTPLIQGRSTNMDTPTILFASLSGGVLAGVYGLLLGIPVAACAKILLTEIAWPRFKAWKEGTASDPLPIGRDAD